MTYCKYLKQKLNRTLECKKQKKIINIKECNGCKYREDKSVTNCHQLNKSGLYRKSPVKTGVKNNHQAKKCTINQKYCANSIIKKRSYKQTKKEKNRYSIIYNDLSKCCVEGCLTPYSKVEKNEVYEGAKRSASIKHGFVCLFCEEHHRQFHNDRDFALYYKKMFQKEFEKTHSRDEFLDIIHCNYL